jgi:hypothetical protein
MEKLLQEEMNKKGNIYNNSFWDRPLDPLSLYSETEFNSCGQSLNHRYLFDRSIVIASLL